MYLYVDGKCAWDGCMPPRQNELVEISMCRTLSRVALPGLRTKIRIAFMMGMYVSRVSMKQNENRKTNRRKAEG